MTTAISVNRVAETAGVSIGSLYQYFPNKDALLGGLIVRFVRRRFDAIQGLITELEQQSIARLEDTPNRIRDVDPGLAAHVLGQSLRATILTALLYRPALFQDPALARELVVLATRHLSP